MTRIRASRIAPETLIRGWLWVSSFHRVKTKKLVIPDSTVHDAAVSVRVLSGKRTAIGSGISCIPEMQSSWRVRSILSTETLPATVVYCQVSSLGAKIAAVMVIFQYCHEASIENIGNGKVDKNAVNKTGIFVRT